MYLITDTTSSYLVWIHNANYNVRPRAATCKDQLINWKGYVDSNMLSWLVQCVSSSFLEFQWHYQYRRTLFNSLHIVLGPDEESNGWKKHTLPLSYFIWIRKMKSLWNSRIRQQSWNLVLEKSSSCNSVTFRLQRAWGPMSCWEQQSKYK